MNQITLDANRRSGKGKGLARKLRAQGLIPAVVYGSKTDNMLLSVDAKRFENLMRHHAGHTLLSLRVGNGEEPKDRMVIVKEVQRDPAHGKILHVDFHEVALDEKISVEVAVVLIGDNIVKQKTGGIVDQVIHEVEVRCLPANIPESIQVDVGNLKVGDTLHVRDIKPPEGVEVVTDGELTVVTVVPPRKVEEVVVAAVEEEVPEEPEVIGKGKRGEEEPEGGESE
ncbi:MAG: 50S ribosomal protein L25 [bacterium]